MRRLYLQIYFSVLAIALLFGVLVAAAWWITADETRERPILQGMSALLSEVLPAADRPRGELEQKVRELAQRFGADVSVFAADGTRLASSALRPVPAERRAPWWVGGPRGPAIALELPDGRRVVARVPPRQRRVGFVGALALLALAAAIGAYPLARRITGRLERLQGRVDALGAGTLSARVDVEGSDEVAKLARSFNQAADRIERLVDAQKSLLASVSHELRTPLARMRIALELLPADARPELRERIHRDIAELDELIGELLLASRLDTLDQPLDTDEVDVLALTAEEAAHTGAEVSGTPVILKADARMLRRLVRNLLENGRRHGGGSPVEAKVGPLPEGGAYLTVADRGPGVPGTERQRIFEPFYRAAGTRGNNEGAGLGLALVLQIARRHGGDARCLAREGGGSVFEVTLCALAERDLRTR